MDVADTGVWRARLRWRLRGALTWPLFVVVTVVEAIVLHELPIAGTGIAWVGALLLAAVINLLVVAVAAPLLGRLMRRRSGPVVPLEVVVDRAAVGLLLGMAAILVAIGVLHHPSVARAQREADAMHGAVYRYVVTQAPAYRPGLRRVSVTKPADHLYRACVPSGDVRRALCLYVETDESPPGVTLDPDHTPNAQVFGQG